MRYLYAAVFSALFFTSLATVVELAPEQDAYICDCKPAQTNPNGNSNYLYFGQFGSCFDRTLIQWDLSCIPGDAVLESAEMRLYCEAFWGSPSGYPVYYPIAESWDQETVTYQTQPELNEEFCITGTWPEDETWLSLDVTDFVESWLNGDYSNYGIYCFCMETSGTSVPGFWSGDYSNETLRPVLLVQYQPLALKTLSWGFIKTLLR